MNKNSVVKKCLCLLFPAVIAVGGGIPDELSKQAESITKPKDLCAGNFVKAEKAADGYRLVSGSTEVFFNSVDLSVTVAANGVDWEFLPPDFAEVKLADGSVAELNLQEYGKISFSTTEFAGVSGIVAHLSDWKNSDLAVDLMVGLEWTTGEVIFELRCIENQNSVRRICWPGAINGKKVDNTVVPFMQGVLIPRNWHFSFDAPYNDALKLGMVYGRTLYMPWWGVSVNGKSGVLILDTPEDSGCYLRHTPDDGTLISPIWVHSSGKMSYARRAVFATMPGDYNDMAHYYRNYAKQNSRYYPLTAKIAKTPLVGDLIGSPIIHTTAYFTDMRSQSGWGSSYTEHIEAIKKLNAQGFDRLYMHIDGVGYRGYDNLEPDQLPIGTQFEGVDGLKKLLAVCHDFGYRVVFHQQFRDFYLDSPSFNEKLLLEREDGSFIYDDMWAGGKNSVLCPHFSQDYVRRNNELLDFWGVNIDGAYLDVFSVIPADECYSAEHPMNRMQTYQARGRCFDYIKGKWGIVSSEEPAEWSLQHLDLVHHAPWPVMKINEQNCVPAIPIPLFSLVYHDSIITPFETGRKRGSYYYADSEIPFLYALLCGGMPYLDLNASEKDVAAVKIVADLHKQVALKVLTTHEILDKDGRKQRAVYEDGTKVTVDQESGSWEIAYPDGRTITGNALAEE